MTRSQEDYGRYERWLAVRDLHLVYVKESEPYDRRWRFIALAEKTASKNYGYAHGQTPRSAVAELCRTVRAHERAKAINPTVWHTYTP